MGCEVRIEQPMNWYEDNIFLGFALFFHLLLPLDDDDELVNRHIITQECKLMISNHHHHYSRTFKVESYGIHLISTQHHHQQNQNQWPQPLRKSTNSSHDDAQDPHNIKDEGISGFSSLHQGLCSFFIQLFQTIFLKIIKSFQSKVFVILLFF